MRNARGTGDACAQVCRRAPAAILVVLVVGHAMDAGAQGRRAGEAPAPIEDVLEGSEKGHGTMSIAYLNTLVNGFRVSDSNIVPIGSVRSHTVPAGSGGQAASGFLRSQP